MPIAYYQSGGKFNIFTIMGLISKLTDKKSQAGKLNEGQYGFKPWMANLIMGLLELVLLVVWFLGSLLSGLSAVFSLDLGLIDHWDSGTSIALAGAYLIWDLLVWMIKPLRTRFNYSESMWNIIFIIWLLFDAIRIIIG